MSRIDEALKRAGDEQEAADTAFDPAAGADGPLDAYPNEPSAPRLVANDGPRVAPVVLRPRVERPAARVPLDPAIADKVVLIGNASPVSVEQYRRLAATLDEIQSKHGIKTLMVTSALPRDGKTLTVTNLAVTLSESYLRRVLLVDADLRRPSVHTIFGLPTRAGLGQIMRSDRSIAAYIDLTPRLTLLPAGEPDQNPVDAFTSGRLKDLLAGAASRYDWVLMDTPPVGLLPDAQLLARLADGVVLVIGAGSTPYPLLQRAISEIGPERIVGTVLNRVKDNTIPMTDYYRNYYLGSAATGTAR